MLRQAEAAKIRILDVKGNTNYYDNNDLRVRQLEWDWTLDDLRTRHNTENFNVQNPALIDENYLLVGNYINEGTKDKIQKGENILCPSD